MPIALYGCEIWGPLSKLEYIRWDKYPIESLHAAFIRKHSLGSKKSTHKCIQGRIRQIPIDIKHTKKILKILDTPKIKCRKHNTSPSIQNPSISALKPVPSVGNSYTNTSISDQHWNQSPLLVTHTLTHQSQTNTETNPLCWLVTNTLTHQSQTNTAFQSQIRVKQIMKQRRKTEGRHIWDNQTRSQPTLECYLLKSDYELAELRAHYFKKFSNIIPNFYSMNTMDKLSIILEEGQTVPLADRFVTACHGLRDSE